VTALAAVLLYLLIRQFMLEWSLRAWAVAALTLVYPADFSQMWLAHVLHARIGWLLALAAASCLLTYLKRRSIGWLVLATVLSLVSLLLYEAHLGVFVAFALLAMAVKRDVPWRTRLMVLVPLAVNSLYVLWRSIGLRAAGGQDQYLSEITLGVGPLAGRLQLGLQVLWWSWTEPVRRLLNLSSNVLALLVLIAGLGGLVWTVMRLADRRFVATTIVPTVVTRSDWMTLLCGLGLIIAGYFPTILLYEPNLDGVYSRVNFYALPGATVCLIFAIGLITQRLARGDGRRWRVGFATAVVMLIGIGMVTQVWVRHNAETAWRDQQDIWTQLFELAPRFEPHTVVCFVLTGYRGQSGFANWWRTPLSAGWEVTAALQLLYDDSSLQGAVIMPDMTGYGEANLLQAGVQTPSTGDIIPYDNIVFLAYDKSQRRLSVLTDAVNALGLGWPVVGYDPYAHIMPGSQPAVALRQLVTQP
jgi:hypothetical protein